MILLQRFTCRELLTALARLKEAVEKQTTDLRACLTERIDLWLNSARGKFSKSLFIPRLISLVGDGGSTDSIHGSSFTTAI